MAIRGDDEINALLLEFGVGQSSAVGDFRSSEEEAENFSDTDGPIQTFMRAFSLCPPSNPSVEIIRHRCYEKFKANVYDAIRLCVPTDNINNPQSAVPLAITQKNHFMRSVVSQIWSAMLPHNIWERFQFSLKHLEADCVREMQRSIRDSGGELPLWCKLPPRNSNGDNHDRFVDQVLNPSVHQIYTWIINGRSNGVVWEPLIPVSSICDGATSTQLMNEKYMRSSLELLEKELQFQFRRTLKQQIEGARKQSKGGKGVKQSLSLDHLFFTMKSFSDDLTDPTNQSEYKLQKDLKGIKKQKQQIHKHFKDNHTSKSDMEEFVTQGLLASQQFKKMCSKLHKKVHYLSVECYSSFLRHLRKCSQDQTQHYVVGSKRKNGPKISLVENDSGSHLDHCDRQASVTFGGISPRINESHMLKLKSMFDRTLSMILPGYSNLPHYQHYFSQSLFTLLLRYDALEGAGLQSAIPPQVFRFLKDRYGCNWECFASPFNCWFENEIKTQSDSCSITSGAFSWSNYGSAFGDTDSLFGSAGSFFDTDFLEISKRQRSGCFQANPPFSSNFIETMCYRIHEVLADRRPDPDSVNTDGKDVDDKETDMDIPMMFIIFVPAWKESPGWKALESSPYLTRHIILRQKDDLHYYAEGTQHRRQKTAPSRVNSAEGSPNEDNRKYGSHRIASFDTSVFFLQNFAAKSKWSLAAYDESELKLAFAMKLGEKKENKDGSYHNRQVKLQVGSSQILKKPDKNIKSPRRHTKLSNMNLCCKKSVSSQCSSKPLKRGNDEMRMVASLGLVDSSSKKRSNLSQVDDRKGQKEAKKSNKKGKK